jgi:hypothetical protein
MVSMYPSAEVRGLLSAERREENRGLWDIRRDVSPGRVVGSWFMMSQEVMLLYARSRSRIVSGRLKVGLCCGCAEVLDVFEACEVVVFQGD